MKQVELTRVTTLVLEDEDGERQTYRYGDTLEVTQDYYDEHEDWFEPVEVEDLESLTVEELRTRLRDRGLKVSGVKAELIDRLS
jgi:hypothetical protein